MLKLTDWGLKGCLLALPQAERERAMHLMRQLKCKHGVFKPRTVARKVECSERTVWRLWDSYDGTPESLNAKYGNQAPSKREVTNTEHDAIVDIVGRYPHIGWTPLHGQLVLHFGYDYPRHMNTVRQYCIRHNLRPAVEIKKRDVLKPYYTAKQIGYKWQVDHKKMCWIDAKGRKHKSRTKVVYVCTDEGSGEQFIAYFDGYGAEQTIEFLKMCHNHYGYWPIVIQMDNGTEFKNQWVKPFITQNGIRYKFNKPATPRWNGKVERRNGNHQIWFFDHNTQGTDNIHERLTEHLYLCNHATSRVYVGKDGRHMSPMRVRAERIKELNRVMAILKVRPRTLQEKIHRYWLYKKASLKSTTWAQALIPRQTFGAPTKQFVHNRVTTINGYVRLFTIRAPPREPPNRVVTSPIKDTSQSQKIARPVWVFRH